MPRTAATPRKRSRGPKRRGGGIFVGEAPRPRLSDVPAGLRRGTPEYRRWEAGRILTLGAAGLSSTQICEQLRCTYDEYRERRRWLVDNAEPGDGMLAWLDFAARSARRTQAAEAALEEITKAKGNLPARVGILRLLHEIDRDLLTMGFEAGVIARYRPKEAVTPDAPGAVPLASQAPELPAGSSPPTERADPHGLQYPDRAVLVAALGILVDHRILGAIGAVGGAPVVRPAPPVAEAARVPPPPA